MYIFTHAKPYSSMMIQDPNVLYYHLCKFEQMGYTWESSRTICTLTAPDETKIHLTRNRYNGFWYFNAIKRHHGAELTRKEIARQFRHYKSTSLYLPLTLMTKYKSITLKRIHSIL